MQFLLFLCRPYNFTNFAAQKKELHCTPPSLDNIKTEPESVKLFVNALFVHRTHIRQNTKFKNILAATVLRFHGSFIEVIGKEPSVKYNDPTHHHLHHKIMSILSESNISKQTFQKWQDEVIAGFNAKNWLGITIKKVGQCSSKRYVDSRSIVKVINEQGDVIRRLHKTIVNYSKDINIMSTTMGGMAQDLQSYGIEMNYYATKLQQVDKGVEVSFILLCFRLCYRTLFCCWIRILCFYLEA